LSYQISRYLPWNGLILNPSMLYLEKEDFANPIFGIEANTWILMWFLTGMQETPSGNKGDAAEESTEQDCLWHLQYPYLQHLMDRKYHYAMRTMTRSALSICCCTITSWFVNWMKQNILASVMEHDKLNEIAK
jgi:hypothetical protein